MIQCYTVLSRCEYETVLRCRADSCQMVRYVPKSVAVVQTLFSFHSDYLLRSDYLNFVFNVIKLHLITICLEFRFEYMYLHCVKTSIVGNLFWNVWGEVMLW